MLASDRQQIEAVVAIVDHVLGEAVVGMYLYGSAVLGGLRPHSDIDVFVLIDRATTGGERHRLVTEIMVVSGPGGIRIAGRPIELTIARLDQLSPWDGDPRREFQYGEWLRGDYEAGFVPEPTRDPDVAILVATLLTASRPMRGVPAADLLAPVPDDDLVASMRRAMPVVMDDLEEDTTNVLLTLARMAYTARLGRIVPKDEAALWAAERLPSAEQEPLRCARRIYLGGATEPRELVPTLETLTTAQLLAAMAMAG